MNNNVAVVTGIADYEGADLSELLLGEGFTIYSAFCRTCSVNFCRIEGLEIHNHTNLYQRGYAFMINKITDILVKTKLDLKRRAFGESEVMPLHDTLRWMYSHE